MSFLEARHSTGRLDLEAPLAEMRERRAMKPVNRAETRAEAIGDLLPIIARAHEISNLPPLGLRQSRHPSRSPRDVVPMLPPPDRLCRRRHGRA